MNTFDCVVAALATGLLGGWLLRAIDEHRRQRYLNQDMKRSASLHTRRGDE